MFRHLPTEIEKLYYSKLHTHVTTLENPLQLFESMETTLVSIEEEEELAKAIISNVI